MDDIVIFSKTFEQHLQHLRQVFERLSKVNLRLKASKCYICCDKIPYLGFVISRKGLHPDPAKVDKVMNWPIPKNKAEVVSFVGLAGYYRKLIKDFAQLEHALRSVTIDEVPFEWGHEQQKAFDIIKEKLTKEPILKLPDFSRRFKFEVTTDASDIGIGAVLSQEGEDGKEHVIQYASRVLTPVERKYHTQEKEALAIVWALDHFRPYLLGDHFNIKTDHHSLEKLWKAIKGRLARWAVNLNEYDYTFSYKPGKSNTNADALSRLPVDDAKKRERILNQISLVHF